MKERGGYSLLFMGRVGKSASANLEGCSFDVVRVFLVKVVCNLFAWAGFFF